MKFKQFLGISCCALILSQSIPSSAFAGPRGEINGTRSGSEGHVSPRSLVHFAATNLQNFQKTNNPSSKIEFNTIRLQFINRLLSDIDSLHSSVDNDHLDVDRALRSSLKTAYAEPANLEQALAAQSAGLIYSLVNAGSSHIDAQRNEWAKLLDEPRIKKIEDIIQKKRLAPARNRILRFMNINSRLLSRHTNLIDNYTALVTVTGTRNIVALKRAYSGQASTARSRPAKQMESGGRSKDRQQETIIQPSRQSLLTYIVAGVGGFGLLQVLMSIPDQWTNLLTWLGVGDYITRFFMNLGQNLHSLLGTPETSGGHYVINIIGPIAEEVLFRAGIMAGLFWLFSKIRIPGKVALTTSSLITAILFVGSHYAIVDETTRQSILSQLPFIVNLFTASLVFSYLYYEFGFIAAVTAHILRDIVATILMDLNFSQLEIARINAISGLILSVAVAIVAIHRKFDLRSFRPSTVSPRTALYSAALIFASLFALNYCSFAAVLEYALAVLGLIVYSAFNGLDWFVARRNVNRTA